MIDDWLAENYRQVREQRGLSWDEMAADFDKANSPSLAAWARSQAAAEPAARATPKRRETTSTRPVSTR